MQTPTSNAEAERRIQKLNQHLNPLPSLLLSDTNDLYILSCASRTKLRVDTSSLSSYMRGKHRDIQEKVFNYFNTNPHLQTPLEIFKDNHRELCMKQLLGLVREAGIKPLHYVLHDPSTYFALLEAVGSVDMSLGIKMGVQYR
ncbi:putative acyl-CoA oxidase [Lupinus albus]|uniref:Putative acyl-CoA oxidase n=1 Tax=Lupinus albus TaxID=3870 RepID=A0A6A4Q9C4_LUPAL|nr:putative acyl-CoA oxidase [Lupinus albus]